MAESKFSSVFETKKHNIPPAGGSTAAGRPRNGKRSDDTYTRLTVLVPEADVKRMKRLLLDEDGKRNMSDYVTAALIKQLDRDSPMNERKNSHTK